MQPQTVFHIVREEIPGTRDDTSSRKAAIASADTSAVAGAATAGVAIRDYHRIIEPVEGSEPKTITAWNLEETTVEFNPNFAAESLKTGEVIRRMKDTAWQQANPDHPITYMAQAVEAYKRLVRAIREKRPLLAFKRGATTAYLVLGGEEERGRKLLAKARFSQDEIETICRQVYGNKQRRT
jgi:hypothetical protein